MSRLPTLFISHGSPMNGIEVTPSSRAWANLGRELPKPRAVLVASAHWESSVPTLSGNAKPETIHDFGGFPEALFQVRYPAPGAPEVATHAVDLLKGAGIAAGVNGCRGLDHGAWVPLKWMYANADVPVLEISLQRERGTAHHVELGRALAPREDDDAATGFHFGVFVHNGATVSSTGTGTITLTGTGGTGTTENMGVRLSDAGT